MQSYNDILNQLVSGKIKKKTTPNGPLTEKQKQRLKILEPQFRKAIVQMNLESAKTIMHDLQDVLRPSGHMIKLIQHKNKLYELAIEKGEFEVALAGLKSHREILSDNTRLYIESTALLAICYLRMQMIEEAKPFIKEVLLNDKVIKTVQKRKIFRSEIIERFNEEVILCSLIGGKKEQFTEDELEHEVVKIVVEHNVQETFEMIGKLTPKAAKEMLFLVYDYSTKQLPSAERLALPSAEQKVKDQEVGKTVFNSIKRVIYNSLCNPESDIYKTWFNNGMQIVLSKGYLRTTILSCLLTLGIGAKMLIAYVVALITKFGIEVYCEKYKPTDLMSIREQK
jgi:hypothetical protein